MEDQRGSACVSAGHVVFFDDGVTEQLKDDVVNSMLYSQLAASARCSRFDDVQAWGVKFKEVMTLFGWLALQERTQRYTHGERATLGLDDLLEQMLDPNVSSPCVNRLKKMCANLKTHRTYSASQQLLLDHALDCRAGAGDTTLTLLISFVSSASQVTTVLFSSTTPMADEEPAIAAHLATQRSVGSLSVTVLSMELSDRQYRRVRARVGAELGASRDALVMAMIEGPPDE